MNAEARPLLSHACSRALSWLLAVPMSLVLLVHPAAMLDAHGGYSHNLLMLIMWGVAAGYVHGVGFDPHAWCWRMVLHPLLGWSLMTLGYTVLLA